MKYDLHIHSKYSNDGVLEPKKIVEIAMKRGLDGIAITDHNTIKGGFETKKYETDDLKVIIGSEVLTEKGEITVFFFPKRLNRGTFKDLFLRLKRKAASS